MWLQWILCVSSAGGTREASKRAARISSAMFCLPVVLHFLTNYYHARAISFISSSGKRHPRSAPRPTRTSPFQGGVGWEEGSEGAVRKIVGESTNRPEPSPRFTPRLPPPTSMASRGIKKRPLANSSSTSSPRDVNSSGGQHSSRMNLRATSVGGGRFGLPLRCCFRRLDPFAPRP